MNSDKNRVFVSYSHQDVRYLKRLQIHLKPIQRENNIYVWDDTRIHPGTNWRAEILSELEKASIAILLVSADFLASDFIIENELPPLLEGAESKGTLILPVIISHCRFEQTESLSKFQAINNPSRPLSSLPVAERERIWVKVAESVEAALKGREPEEGWEVTTERRVLEAITDLVNNGIDGSFLVIDNGDYYVQFLYTKSESILYCEALTNAYLSESEKLGQEALNQLLTIGFTDPSDEESNYYREYSLSDNHSILQEIASIVVRVFSEVYKISRNSKFEFTISLEG